MNVLVAQLGAALTRAGLTHSLVGIPEAQGEGVAAMLVLTRFALGQASADDVRVALAIFLTSCTRGRYAPQLAIQLAHRRELPRSFAPRIDALLAALESARERGLLAVADVAAAAWDNLGITRGDVPWRRASYGFLAIVTRLTQRGAPDSDSLSLLEREAFMLRTGSLVTDSRARTSPTTLMNFHQTKGREADAVILVYRDGDYLADSGDREPYTDSSRVLYVALTRARRMVSVILPATPHPLVAPLSHYAA